MQKARRQAGSARYQGPPKTRRRGDKEKGRPLSPLLPFSLSPCLAKIAGPGLTKRPPTACRHVVSGSLSSPCRGSSHLSLALLGSLSVAREYLALRDGPRGFRLTSTCRVLLRYRFVRFHLSRTGLSPTLVELSSSLPLGYSLSKHRPYNPMRTCPHGLGSSAFARRY